jgi:thiamine-monophosphate kinase
VKDLSMSWGFGMPSLAELGENALLAELARRGLVTGIEDDVAVLPGDLVVTQDALVEDVHFRLAWTSFRDLGYKAAAVNLSDLAAAGADPEALLVTLCAPATLSLDAVVELYEGLAEAGVSVRGGDTTASEKLVLSVTALGRSARVPGRSGAQPGDYLVVTGPLGGSAAGLRALEAGHSSSLTAAHLRPPIRLAEGKQLARTAHALMDISDGLATDLPRLAAASGVCCAVDLDLVPRFDGVDTEEAARGGEDYELLAALPDPGDWHVIGRCNEGEGVDYGHHYRDVRLRGFEHFR